MLVWVRGPHNFRGAPVAKPAPTKFGRLVLKLLLQPTPQTQVVYQI